MRILLLANSHKPGGRCLAGLTDSGTWIRPVSSPRGGAISVAAATSGGTALRPLDIIELVDLSTASLAYQSENVVVDESSIRKIGVGSPTDPRLSTASTHVAWFMARDGDSISADVFEGSSGAESLAYVEVDDLTVVRRVSGYNGRIKWRACFTYNSRAWDVALTDDNFTASLDATIDIGRAGICVSVGEVLPAQSAHFKLAAGIIAL